MSLEDIAHGILNSNITLSSWTANPSGIPSIGSGFFLVPPIKPQTGKGSFVSARCRNNSGSLPIVYKFLLFDFSAMLVVPHKVRYKSHVLVLFNSAKCMVASELHISC